jgi:glycine/D-amino acid oxidase-like deaminating enzyme
VGDFRKKSFWMESLGAYRGRPPLDGSTRADVLIIGAGFTGLSTAIHLKEKRPSLKVLVLESDVVGFGASGRNGGFSMRLFGITMELTAMRYGREKTKEADRYMVKAVDHLERMVQKYRIECDYVRHGMMTVAANPRQLKHLEKEMRLAEELGIKGLRWLTAEEARALVDSPTYLGARFDEHCALVHPVKLVRGLADAAERLGVDIRERTRVLDIRPDKSEVRTDRGIVRADSIVIATNAFSGLFSPLRAKQLPVYTYIALTEPLPAGQLKSLGWERRIGIEDARNLLHYYRLTPDNRLLFGGSDAIYYYGGPLDRDRNELIFARLKRAVAETFPQLQGIRFTHHWGGPISATLDLVPVIGRIRPNVWYSVGCMGHGVSLTNYNGLTIAELLLGEESERTDFFIVGRRVTPLPPEPFRFLLAEAILRFFRYGDRKGMRAGKT